MGLRKQPLQSPRWWSPRHKARQGMAPWVGGRNHCHKMRPDVDSRGTGTSRRLGHFHKRASKSTPCATWNSKDFEAVRTSGVGRQVLGDICGIGMRNGGTALRLGRYGKDSELRTRKTTEGG